MANSECFICKDSMNIEILTVAAFLEYTTKDGIYIRIDMDTNKPDGICPRCFILAINETIAVDVSQKIGDKCQD